MRHGYPALGSRLFNYSLIGKDHNGFMKTTRMVCRGGGEEGGEGGGRTRGWRRRKKRRMWVNLELNIRINT